MSTKFGRSFIQHVVATGLWGTSPMAVVDVGASGGLDHRWSVFGERLVALGFDPLSAEVERLNALETRQGVRYEAAFVGCHDFDRLFPPELREDEVASRYNQPFTRSSAVAAHEIQHKDYIRDEYNAGVEVRYTKRVITLDEYLATSPLRPNALKIDTDGSDFQVLLGAEILLSSPDLFCIQIEVQFHGHVHDYANTFSNIDRFLKPRGFSLFDLKPYRYSRAALPAPFAKRLPAQTMSGQVHCGEAVYFRDLGLPLYPAMFHVEVTRERLLKLCCLFAAYGLDDCAAELLAVAPALADLPERTQLLNALTPDRFGDTIYTDYLARFEKDPSAWLPQSLPIAPRAAAMTATVPELYQQVANLEAIQRELRHRLKRKNEKIKRLQEERLRQSEQRRRRIDAAARKQESLTALVTRVRAAFRRRRS